jgi:hypothetical protein
MLILEKIFLIWLTNSYLPTYNGVIEDTPVDSSLIKVFNDGIWAGDILSIIIKRFFCKHYTPILSKDLYKGQE